MAKVKKVATPVRVAQSREECAEMIATIGGTQREIIRIEATMNDELAVIKAGYEAQAEPLRDRVEALQEGVQEWCEAHRDTLTGGGKVKHHAFSTGHVSWRLRPPSVALRGVESILAACKAAGLGRFVRVKESVDKEAMLADPTTAGALKGVTIQSVGEDFAIEPFEVELEAAG